MTRKPSKEREYCLSLSPEGTIYWGEEGLMAEVAACSGSGSKRQLAHLWVDQEAMSCILQALPRRSGSAGERQVTGSQEEF